MPKPNRDDTPRDDLFRMMVPVSEFRFEGDDGNTLVGYAATFDTPTRIDSWEGMFDETIQRGAFAKTIAERADRIKVLYDHGLDPSIGNKPIATVESLVEDDHGLRLEATFIDRPYAHDIRAAIAAGAISGMSFRFTVIRDEWDESGDIPQRTLKEVRVKELGPVTFPAYEATSAGVRSAKVYERFNRAVDDGAGTTPTEPAIAATPSDDDEPPFDGTRATKQIPVIRGRIARFLKEESK